MVPATVEKLIHAKCVPCHHSMTCPQVADGGNSSQLWRVQTLKADKWWSSSLRVRHGANFSSYKIIFL
jgi:hypothetical protein